MAQNTGPNIYHMRHHRIPVYARIVSMHYLQVGLWAHEDRTEWAVSAERLMNRRSHKWLSARTAVCMGVL